ncbi:aminotransferase class I/II-fold pyridoxal phosphate-dependent enzyme [Mucilaginibacter auburnensis]|uniref:Glycine C-acetyltransferase n=1 Tax=Mucilaginibacter auburnensis TaxID=1457233 RepID=A0A2H9VR68_9SPHI|nr:aminotransferase class I/II-fold pyridoxal phosphate-dependent enzyme [Mucilaginibacter auburnensis]PJJ83299.1 glycine C-acetyltransferase [Mucilaginibacter auburnensis]
MDINYLTASFKDFENIPDLDIFQRAAEFNRYLDYLQANGRLNYRFVTHSGCLPEVLVEVPGKGVQKMVGLVSNDYLGFTQHPEVKAAAIAAIEQYGTGAGASPAIGGHFLFHEQLEQKMADFFHREAGIVYTTGYTANSATLQCLLKKEDIAILDMGVHASVMEGCQLTNVKRFLHNDLADLERILIASKDSYRTRLVVIDGVYSQDGDLAPLGDIIRLVRQYGAFLMIDDAHGTGVIGKTGRGVIELHGLFQEVDLISGTFSKTFGVVGGYVVGKPELIRYLKFQSRQHLFSVTLPPAAAGILKAIDLLDEEPEWMGRLWKNVHYFTAGLNSLGLDIGTTQSAIVPVRIGDPAKTAAAGQMLLDRGIYANPIIYPAVPRKDARIRMSLMATHTREHLDKVLNAFEDVSKQLQLPKAV